MSNLLKTSIMAACATIIVSSCNDKKIEYPAAPVADVVDEYFGEKVNDPYRLLEDDTAQVTTEWVEAQRKVTEDYLSQIPFRDKLRERLTQLNDYVKPGMPSKRDGVYYFYANDGLQNQSVLYRTKDLTQTPEVFLDPNTLSEDGTVALSGTSFSNDGKYMAYMISRSGSDWVEIYVMDVATKELLSDHIQWAKFTSAAWAGDGFYYSA